MNKPLTLSERIHRAFSAPTRGILGLVDELLDISQEHDVSLDWLDGRYRIRIFDSNTETDWTEVAARQSVVRAVLAHFATLCNRRSSTSVSPYGGEGELLVGDGPTVRIRVAFTNTPDEQRLMLASRQSEGRTSADSLVSEENHRTGLNLDPEAPISPLPKHPAGVQEYLLSLEPPSSARAPTGSDSADRMIAVPPGQAVWLSGSPIELTTIITVPSAGGLIVKTSPLTLLGALRCTGWLADHQVAAVERGTRGKMALEFALEPVIEPRYFVEEYQSPQRDVVFAVDLDGAPIPLAILHQLFQAAAQDLASGDPDRAAIVAAIAARLGEN